jgi:hypothetical protein
MNLEKIIEWGAIILAVILGVRFLAGLFGTGDPVQPSPQMYGPGIPAVGWPYGTGVVVMQTGIVGQQPWGGRCSLARRGRNRRNRTIERYQCTAFAGGVPRCGYTWLGFR